LTAVQVRRYLDSRRKLIDRELRRLPASGKPAIVYDPIRHTFASGGKRLRAIITLLACGAVGGDESAALGAAVAVESLHNFTLIHDDVMDRSPVRRGRLTVHAKWNDAVAILSGDQLLSLGYRALLADGKGKRARGGRNAGGRNNRAEEMVAVYTRALREVCEGQGYDLAFEARRSVTMREYIGMIDLKTARVIAAAAEIGALAGGGNAAEAGALKRYGRNLGLAFQIRDDVLDVTGSAKEFGKKIGGDIARGKKTYLFVKALERARGKDLALLRSVAAGRGAGKVGAVRSVYERTGAIDAARRDVTRFTRGAQGALRRLPASGAKAILADIAVRLADRTV
jgi:geranylgeranyl diphosphate synthase type II